MSDSDPKALDPRPGDSESDSDLQVFREPEDEQDVAPQLLVAHSQPPVPASDEAEKFEAPELQMFREPEDEQDVAPQPLVARSQAPAPASDEAEKFEAPELQMFREPEDEQDATPQPLVARSKPPAAPSEPSEQPESAPADEGEEDEEFPGAGQDVGLRSLAPSADAEPRRPPRIVAIAGARGGVGKTILATNLGLYFATIGRRVVIVDADAGGGNVHTCIGTRPAMPLPRLRKAQRADGGGAIPEEAIATTPFQGLMLLNAGLDEPAGSAQRGDRLARLLPRLRELQVDYVIIDMGVGMSREFIDSYLDADLSIFVLAPEPTAVESTYRFLRGAFSRHLLHTVGLEPEQHAELERRLKAHGGAPMPQDLLDELEQEQHPLAAIVRQAMSSLRLRFVVNQTRLRSDLQLGFFMQSVVRRRLGINLDYLGHIDHDDTVWTCVRSRKPVLLNSPGAKSSKKIEKLARRLLVIDAGKEARVTGAPPTNAPRNSHHDVLELDRGATDEEIRRAFKRCREVYAHDSLCCYGLLEPNEIEKLRTRLDEAFDVLLDSARRRPYELSMFPDEPAPRVPMPAEDAEEEQGRPMPDLTPDTQFTGMLLRQVREAKRIGLRDISQRTKIGLTYLKAIEAEDFSKLPAVVYTTGFVTELARFLRLDQHQVSRTYIRRYKRYLEERERGGDHGA